MTALIDTNIFLDAILTREPFCEASRQVIAASELEFFEGYCCATTITDIFYITRKSLGKEAAFASVRHILRTSKIAPVTHSEISGTLASGMDDFEDGILVQSAINVGASTIVTRNVPDCDTAAVTALTPADFLSILKNSK